MINSKSGVRYRLLSSLLLFSAMIVLSACKVDPEVHSICPSTFEIDGYLGKPDGYIDLQPDVHPITRMLSLSAVLRVPVGTIVEVSLESSTGTERRTVSTDRFGFESTCASLDSELSTALSIEFPLASVGEYRAVFSAAGFEQSTIFNIK